MDDDPTKRPFTPMMHVRPGPVTAAVRKLPEGIYALHFEHSTGATSFLVEAAWLEGFIAQLQEASGGIIVARPLIK